MAKRLKRLSDPVLGLDGEPLRTAPTPKVDEQGNPVLDAAGRLVQDDGEPILVKSVLANPLARGQSDDPLRAMEVARKIHTADSQVVIDDQDLKLLQAAVKADRVLNDMAKAAGLAVLAAAEDIEKPVDPPS